MVSNALAMPWVIPTIFGCGVAMVAIIANVVSSTLKANAETRLKQRMVEQGYSPDDIVRVIRASAGEESDDDEFVSSAKPSKPPKQYKAMA